MKRIIGIITIVLLVTTLKAQTVKILFDATKAETAGSANWVIDADLDNLFWKNNGTVTTVGGTRANAQQIPTLAQANITTSTPETYWNGALSYWGIDCVKKGYKVESLPYNGKITYNDNTNAQDLKNYKVFIICEPNILFTAAEKTALMNFVSNGGGLFIISDHAGADRNNDGSDSPTIWNDFFTNNSVKKDPFGIRFSDTLPNGNVYPSDLSEISNKVITSPTNPIITGAFGNVAKLKYNGGTTMTLNKTNNSTVTGVIYSTKSTSTLNGVLCAYATYGKGKIVAIGDSSPCDDGTTTSSTATVYVSYANDASVGNNHQNLFMNATIWLATGTVTPVEITSFEAFQKENQNLLQWKVANEVNFNQYVVEKSTNSVEFNTIGSVKATNAGQYQFTDNTTSSTAYYRLKLMDNNGSFSYSKTVTITNTASTSPLKLYPNPVINGKLYLSYATLKNAATIRIIDQAGKVCYSSVLTKNSTTTQIAVEGFKKGVYFVSIPSMQGATPQKFVIQ